MLQRGMSEQFWKVELDFQALRATRLSLEAQRVQGEPTARGDLLDLGTLGSLCMSTLKKTCPGILGCPRLGHCSQVAG